MMTRRRWELLPRIANLLRGKQQQAQDRGDQIRLAIQELTQPLAQVN